MPATRLHANPLEDSKCSNPPKTRKNRLCRSKIIPHNLTVIKPPQSARIVSTMAPQKRPEHGKEFSQKTIWLQTWIFDRRCTAKGCQQNTKSPKKRGTCDRSLHRHTRSIRQLTPQSYKNCTGKNQSKRKN